MANRTSQHILTTSANLLGFCLFVITSFHLTSQADNYVIDECTSVVALFLTISSLMSFISIRTKSESREHKFERAADFFFLVGLLGIFAIIAFMTISFWDK